MVAFVNFGAAIGSNFCWVYFSISVLGAFISGSIPPFPKKLFALPFFVLHLSPNRLHSGSVRYSPVFLGIDYFGIGWAAHSGTELNLGSELPPPNQFPKNPPSDRPLLARSFGGA
jgi:hypothetical protein